MQTGSSDQAMPKGVKYSVRGNISGLKHYFANVQAAVSSIQQLTESLYMQTESHQNAQRLRSRAQHSDGKWSSAKIAELLKLQTNEKEQLEGFINAEIESLQKFWSFDNHTIEQLPKGKFIQYATLKMVVLVIFFCSNSRTGTDDEEWQAVPVHQIEAAETNGLVTSN